MKLLCDTNVLLDVALHREPFFDASALALGYCEDESVSGLVADTSLTNLFYIIHHAVHDNEISYQALEATLEVFNAVSPTAADIKSSIARRHRDFEDCLLAIIAEREQCDYVLTRNIKDFMGYSFKPITPEEFVKISL